MVRPAHKSREAARRLAQKKLEALDYTPQAARHTSEILICLAEKSGHRRAAVLECFSQIANIKITWEIAPR